MRFSAVLVVATVYAASFAEPAHHGTLTFADRVSAQEAIERVYYAHQVGATKSFEVALPRSVLESKVRKYLEQSAALAVYWKTNVTDEMLQRELERMAHGTRMPERLIELYSALGNDSFLIKECLARATLVDRLTRNFYAFDQTLHAEERRRAEELRQHLADGDLSVLAEHPNRSTVELILSEEAGPERSARASSRHELSRDEFEKQRRQLPGSPGSASPIKEERDAFVFSVVLSETAREVQVASYVVPKTTWDDWWKTPKAGLTGVRTDTVASNHSRIPELAEGAATVGLPCAADDSWDNGTLDNLPDPRRFHTAIWTGSLMVVWGGYTQPVGALNTGGRYDPATDSWEPTSTIDAPSARYRHTAIWTGSAMVVWGGSSDSSGGRYDPQTNTWTATSTINAPSGRSGQTAIWTGSLMVVWGGTSDSTGGRYDPSADSWTPTATTGAPTARSGHTAIWTGSRMVVWGGGTDGNPLNTGGRYSPISNAWTPTSTIGAPSVRSHHSAIWTGSAMVVWGGFGANPGDLLDSGGRYNPATDSWLQISTTGAPRGRFDHSVVWNGALMIVWGGYWHGGPTPDGHFNSGGRYDPASNTWSPTSTTDAPAERSDHTAVWTGSLMVVWGGNYEPYLNSGGRYDPVTDSWTPTSTVGAGPARTSMSAVWTGNLMVVWGGSYYDYRQNDFNTGGRYEPATDSWTPTATTGAPSPRDGHTAVWTGSTMVVWGGTTDSTGGTYDPTSDTWTPTSTTGAPEPRNQHTAVWTGNRMIVWGGFNGGAFVNSGGRYDPATDSWTATSTIDAPTGRRFHTAVWAGSRMVVWGGDGGFGGGGDLNTGGRYDPTTDSWTPTSMIDVPSGRDRHTAVWTAGRMVVWGGHYSDFPNDFYLSNGGRYDPASDSWTPTSTIGAPAARADHTAVWTGNIMVVWGGSGDVSTGVNLSTGGRYNPTADSWMPTSMINAPPPRFDHTAVWTGSAMIVWAEDTGGRYILGASVDDDGDGYSECQGDCNDEKAAIHPGTSEVCDGLDNNCNGLADDDGGGVDSDSDSIHNACDNCIFDFDPTQSDFDHDGQGDACDVNDGLIFVFSSDKSAREWQSESGYSSWNSYRGSLAVLRATGQYTQAPGSNALAARDCDLDDPYVLDALVPAPGDVAFHLVTGVANGIESGLGANHFGVARPNANPCP